MSRALYISFLLLCAINVHAGEIRLATEISDAHRASSVAYVDTVTSTEAIERFQFGISINRLSSDEQLERDNRKTIKPVYLFLNIALNKPITPYFEIGFDLGDELIAETFHTDDEEVDWYYSLGVSFEINRALSLDVYRKKYELFYTDGIPYITDNVDLYLSGLSISYRF